MAIQSSSFTLGSVQKDGRRWVREAHTDSTGVVILFDYLAADGIDYSSIMNERVPSINETLSDEEAKAEIASNTAFPPVQNTLAQLSIRLWAMYDSNCRLGNKDALHRMIWWIIQRVNDGLITSDQVRQSYNAYFHTSYTLSQWNTYVTNNLVPVSNRYASWVSQQQV